MSALTKWNPFRKSNGGEEWGPLSQWNPAREMERFENRMLRLFRNWPAWPELNEPLAVADWAPQVDITEDDKEYLVKAEAPEVKKEDLKVRVEAGVLSITGERKSEKEEKGKKIHRIERAYGSFERSFTLPDDVDTTKVSSDFKDGVIKVHLPKNPNARPKATEIKIQ
jgi:HSP20 family protein